MTPTGNHLPQEGPVVLAIETSGMCGSIALVTGRECIGEYSLQSKLTHSRRLLAGIDWLLGEAGLDWPGIGGIAVSLGPGSFTGLRIGLSTAKGLAMATGAPLLGVSALDGLAAQLAHAALPVCPVLDARKKEVYAAFFRSGPEGRPHKTSDSMVLPPAALAAMISEPTLLVGDGAALYGDLFRERLGGLALFPPAPVYFPRAAAIGFLALGNLARGEVLDPAAAVPIYIRPSEAELKLF
ncbi:MAG: tRNA (adenosine(37)-N6)-threonylcarbamoyltransferase complex dimerization subunit type 1 TsaB [Desulfobacteraceae bacterium]|nr:tRNA (adenosine(37)-N6)-threonylcarbamoyltransferase complex dimerization subunit type 1 TsaB [Desulfobacteraceae bacterium]